MGRLNASITLTCALISISNYDAQFANSTIRSLIYPNKNDAPIINKHGNYGIKIRFNGAQRLVSIDDRMPVSNDKKPLLITHKDDFATQLLEKALIKLYGS